MVEKIVFTVGAFILFIYIFLVKMIKKNDTTYLIILGIETIGILINFMQIIFGVFYNAETYILIYLLSIIIPIAVIILEKNKLNVSELIHIFISKILLKMNNRKKAKEILFNILDKYKDSYLAHKMLAEIYEIEGGMRKAIDEYVKVLDIKKNDYKSYYKISVLLYDLEKKDEAIQMLTTLIKSKPEHYEATKLLGDLLIEKENFKKAVEVYSKAIKYNEDKFDIYYNLGIAYARLNEFSLAKGCFEKVIELNDDYYNAYYRLGQIALLYRDFDVAINCFAKSAYKDKEAKSYFELTKVYIMKNEKNRAAMSMNKCIESDYSFFNKVNEEPILFPIKELIKEPTEKQEKVEVNQSEKEKMIEEYLNDTYNLIKILNKQTEENNKASKFKWNKK